MARGRRLRQIRRRVERARGHAADGQALGRLLGWFFLGCLAGLVCGIFRARNIDGCTQWLEEARPSYGALLSSGKLPEQSVPLLSMLIAAAAAFAGAMTAAAAAGQRRLPVSLAVGAVYLLLMLMGRGLWFRGQWSALPAIAVAAAALTAGLLSSRPKKRRR